MMRLQVLQMQEEEEHYLANQPYPSYHEHNTTSYQPQPTYYDDQLYTSYITKKPMSQTGERAFLTSSTDMSYETLMTLEDVAQRPFFYVFFLFIFSFGSRNINLFT